MWLVNVNLQVEIRNLKQAFFCDQLGPETECPIHPIHKHFDYFVSYSSYS